MDLDGLKYPNGKFAFPAVINEDSIDSWIRVIESFPEKLTDKVKGLSEIQLSWQYRPGGWNIRQIIHHCADSHMNSLIRFKLTLTEDRPKIKPYLEDRWGELVDSTSAPIDSSLGILNGLHIRWIHLLKHINDSDLSRTFIHPETNREIRIDENISLYAWHCKHHLAHVQQAIQSKGKF